jgi:hypothetical protein
MPQPRMLQGVVDTNLGKFCCPVAPAWAPYFMDFKMQFKALKMGWALLVTLTNSADITISIGVSPLLDWLRAACVRFGPTATKRTQSLVDQTFEPTALDARVVA